MKIIIFILLTTVTSVLYVPVSYSNELTLGVHPYKSVSKLQKYYLPLAAYLSEKLNKKVSLNIAKNYGTHIDLIGRDQLDIAYMGPASYVSLVNKHGKKRLLARQVIKGKPTFKGHILARANSKMSKLSDLKGKAFAFGDPNSTMSHLVPRYMIIKHGVTKEVLKK